MTQSSHQPRPADTSDGVFPLPPMPDPLLDQWAAHEGPYIPAQARELLRLAICYCQDKNGVPAREHGTAFPSEQLLAHHLGDVDQAVVSRLFKRLKLAGFVRYEAVPAENGYTQNIYTFTGLDTGWAVTKSKAKLSQEDVYALQARLEKQERENAALHRLLAEAVDALAVHDPDHAEKLSYQVVVEDEDDSSPSTDDNRMTSFLSYDNTDVLSDPEKQQIIGELDDWWYYFEQATSWGGKNGALNWYTRMGKCRKTGCFACTRRFPQEPNPHRAEFRRKLEEIKQDAAKPAGEENTVQCQSCGQRKQPGQLNDVGMCGECVDWEQRMEEARRL